MRPTVPAPRDHAGMTRRVENDSRPHPNQARGRFAASAPCRGLGVSVAPGVYTPAERGPPPQGFGSPDRTRSTSFTPGRGPRRARTTDHSRSLARGAGSPILRSANRGQLSDGPVAVSGAIPRVTPRFRAGPDARAWSLDGLPETGILKRKTNSVRFIVKRPRGATDSRPVTRKIPPNFGIYSRKVCTITTCASIAGRAGSATKKLRIVAEESAGDLRAFTERSPSRARPKRGDAARSVREPSHAGANGRCDTPRSLQGPLRYQRRSSLAIRGSVSPTGPVRLVIQPGFRPVLGPGGGRRSGGVGVRRFDGKFRLQPRARVQWELFLTPGAKRGRA